MNELDFIRRQVATERRHMAATRRALSAALAADYAINLLAEFTPAAASYLVFIVTRFNRQDQAHCTILRPRISAAATTDHDILNDLTETLRQSSSAIATLGGAVSAYATATDQDLPALLTACRQYLHFFNTVLVQRRHAIYHLFAQHYALQDWRDTSLVDADAILQERSLYSAVTASLPAGIELQAASQTA